MMEIGEDMEVEEDSKSTPKPNAFKRLGLKNTIQTNFGEDYVFQIVPKSDWTSMAVSLSTNAVKLYSPHTGQYLGECKGHSSTINEILFNGDVLYSCSSDSTIRAWDSRSFSQVSCINTGPLEEVFSLSFGGAGDNLLAAGCNSQIRVWDRRKTQQIACFEESHMEDVTQVRFVTGHQNKLVSASVDGLMCLFDTSGHINEDDSLVSVFNVGTSIGKIGFFGDINYKIWCLTHIETLSIWDWPNERTEAIFEDARPLASKNWALDHVDYFVDCHYSAEEDRLWVIGGTNAGTFGYFPITYRQGSTIGSPEAVFQGGHSGIVRTVLPVSGIRGLYGWTGGEDGRLCCWLSDDNSADSFEASWVSSSFAEKPPPKNRRNHRHSPY